jgi:hypothetical protein
MGRVDCGGRRSGDDRRQLALPFEFPERRLSEDRRGGDDRRSGSDRRSRKGFRALVGLDRRRWFGKKVL